MASKKTNNSGSNSGDGFNESELFEKIKELSQKYEILKSEYEILQTNKEGVIGRFNKINFKNSHLLLLAITILLLDSFISSTISIKEVTENINSFLETHNFSN